LEGSNFDAIEEFIDHASGVTLSLNWLLWIYWPEIAARDDVPSVYRALEEGYTRSTQGLQGLQTFDAFKQHAHRIGLSQYLAQKNIS